MLKKICESIWLLDFCVGFTVINTPVAFCHVRSITFFVVFYFLSSFWISNTCILRPVQIIITSLSFRMFILSVTCMYTWCYYLLYCLSYVPLNLGHHTEEWSSLGCCTVQHFDGSVYAVILVLCLQYLFIFFVALKSTLSAKLLIAVYNRLYFYNFSLSIFSYLSLFLSYTFLYTTPSSV